MLNLKQNCRYYSAHCQWFINTPRGSFIRDTSTFQLVLSLIILPNWTSPVPYMSLNVSFQNSHVPYVSFNFSPLKNNTSQIKSFCKVNLLINLHISYNCSHNVAVLPEVGSFQWNSAWVSFNIWKKSSPKVSLSLNIFPK